MKPKFFSYTECAAWCEAHNYPTRIDNYGRPSPALDSFASEPLEYPADSGKKVYVARNVITDLMDERGLLLWIDDWAVWPSGIHMPLFTRLREALGEARPLIEAPGQMFEPPNLDDAISVLACALFFHWDCYVFSAAGGPAYFCSHNESAELIVRSDWPLEGRDAYEGWGLIDEEPR